MGIICSCLILLPAFMDRCIPESVKSSTARLLSHTLSLSFIRSRHRASSVESGQGNWSGYRHRAESGSQRFVKLKPSQAILKTESFKLDYAHDNSQPQPAHASITATQIPVPQRTKISVSSGGVNSRN